jgi:hypothetical protein
VPVTLARTDGRLQSGEGLWANLIRPMLGINEADPGRQRGQRCDVARWEDASMIQRRSRRVVVRCSTAPVREEVVVVENAKRPSA